MAVLEPFVMPNAVKHRQTKVPKQPGEMARLKVVQGPDKGVVFVVTGNRVSIGRGEENDVMFMDLKQPLKKGEAVPIKLRFEAKDKTFKTIEIKAQVRELGASPHK